MSLQLILDALAKAKEPLTSREVGDLIGYSRQRVTNYMRNAIQKQLVTIVDTIKIKNHDNIYMYALVKNKKEIVGDVTYTEYTTRITDKKTGITEITFNKKSMRAEDTPNPNRSSTRNGTCCSLYLFNSPNN